jgi:PAS domain-containing protein
MRDITEKKKAEDALKQSERLLADIIDFLPDATFAIDVSGAVIAWNRAIERLTGIAADAIIGKRGYEHARAIYGKPKPMLIDKCSSPFCPVWKCMLPPASRIPDGRNGDTAQRRRCHVLCKAGLIYDYHETIIAPLNR